MRASSLSKIGRGRPLGNRSTGAALCPQVTSGDRLDDSKKLTPLQRERIAEELRRTAVCYAYGLISPEEIEGWLFIQGGDPYRRHSHDQVFPTFAKTVPGLLRSDVGAGLVQAPR